MSGAWGDKCFICGADPDDKTYGLIGPLTYVTEQKMICSNCIDFLKKVRHRT
jgi:hypothetical protein